MCYQSLMHIAGEQEDIRTVALCGVSTGIFGFDLRVATNIALREVRNWMDKNADKIDKVFFIIISECNQLRNVLKRSSFALFFRKSSTCIKNSCLNIFLE